MRIALILAVAEHGVIGRDNGLPWRIASDMRRFKSLTMGKPIIMGRKQYQSVGRPLPGRDNIVLSRDPSFTAPGCEVVRSLAEAIALATAKAEARAVDEVFIIGGADLYGQALARADRIYLSRVRAQVAGDAKVDLGDLSRWREIAREDVPAGPGDEHAHTFLILDRSG